ncbi:TRAFAC clade GTPase domain-containing protein [Flavobacterium facile]|uniref:TRAFAC clade GTPase domain-containing protein n=1 Tax=Flavobacterium facile TaxID=2893174 RepID=UPI002E78A295|nr:hypothetical protein [Flavobacterium sp. T-12]
MNDIIKKQILLECNNLEIQQLVKLINENNFTILDFQEAGLDFTKLEAVKTEFDIVAKAKIQAEIERKRKEEEEMQLAHKNHAKIEILEKIKNNKINADDIKSAIKSKFISISDIEEIDLSNRLKKALVNYVESDTTITSYSVNELPEMQEGRTDIYCIGLAGTGKTTMLTGLLKVAHEKGALISDTYAGNQGINFQTTIIQNLSRGFIPPRTAHNSYIYVPVSINDENGIAHPLNIVDVPGEIFKNITETGEAQDFLKYINNNNKKIFFIVIDSMIHGNYDAKTLDQSLVYPNILQILKSEGIADSIDAIYFVTNKFDYLKDNEYGFDDREDGDLALEYINTHFKALITNCFNLRDNSKYKFRIKSLPFSIGKLRWGAVVEEFDKKYSETLLEILLNDSFIVKGGSHKVFN